MTNITIDVEKCIGCGACVNACPVELYVLDKEKGKAKVKSNVEDCVLCRACEATCPVEAIKVSEN